MDENKIIELVDENGETVQLQLLAGLEHEDVKYLAVTDDLSEDEDGECGVFFLCVEEDEEGETYEPVEDEDLMEVLFNKFMALIEDGEDEDDE